MERKLVPPTDGGLIWIALPLSVFAGAHNYPFLRRPRLERLAPVSPHWSSNLFLFSEVSLELAHVPVYGGLVLIALPMPVLAGACTCPC